MVMLASRILTCTIMAEPRAAREKAKTFTTMVNCARSVPFLLLQCIRDVVLSFLLRLLAPPDLLLLGYGRSWTETEGRNNEDRVTVLWCPRLLEVLDSLRMKAAMRSRYQMYTIATKPSSCMQIFSKPVSRS